MDVETWMLSIIKESVTLNNELRINICEIKANKDKSALLIIEGLQTSLGSEQSKVLCSLQPNQPNYHQLSA